MLNFVEFVSRSLSKHEKSKDEKMKDGKSERWRNEIWKTNYEKAVVHIESAKKHEKKGKLEKAKQSYAKAQKLLIKSNEIPASFGRPGPGEMTILSGIKNFFPENRVS